MQLGDSRCILHDMLHNHSFCRRPISGCEQRLQDGSEDLISETCRKEQAYIQNNDDDDALQILLCG